MSERLTKITRSTAFLRGVLIAGLGLVVLVCCLVYFKIYNATDGQINDKDPEVNKVTDKRGIENYFIKWKKNAKVINIGENKQQTRMVYYGTHAIDKETDNVRRIVFTIHGMGRNAAASFEYANIYYTNIINDERGETVIIAPNYTGKKWQRLNFKKVIKWDADWAMGGMPRKEYQGVKLAPGVSINAFSIMDYLTYEALKSFKKAYEIGYVGFSAGSQMLQRYLSMSPYVFDLWSRNFYISVYLISPGEYMYYGTERANTKYTSNCNSYKSLRGCLELALTKSDFWKTPQKTCKHTYNMYKYGIENIDALTNYVPNGTGTNVIASGAFLRYPVTYFVGSKDTNPPRAKSCPAMHQGSTRIQRLFLFYSYVKFLYAAAPHSVAVIPGCQHNEHCIGTNKMTALFFSPGVETIPNRSGSLNPFKLYWDKEEDSKPLYKYTPLYQNDVGGDGAQFQNTYVVTAPVKKGIAV